MERAGIAVLSLMSSLFAFASGGALSERAHGGEENILAPVVLALVMWGILTLLVIFSHHSHRPEE